MKIFLLCLCLVGLVFANENKNLSPEAQCENGNALSCFKLGESFSKICLDEQNFDIGAKAIKYYEKACSAKQEPACFMVAFMYSTNQCVPRNIELAQKYAKISCDEERQSDACGLYARSEGLNEQEKQKYLQKACEYNERWCHKVNK